MIGENGRIIAMRLALCAFAILLSFIFVHDASAFNDLDLLTTDIKATEIKGQSIDDMLDVLAVDYGIPLGIELGDPKLTPPREIDLKLPATNSKDFLDAETAKDPRYTWKLEGGVIHLYPVNGHDPLVATLLATKISHFGIIGEASRYAVCSDVMNLPEIGSKLVIPDVSPMIFLNFGSMHKFEKRTVFDESNLTLRELLDRIVLKTNMKRWVLTHWGKSGEFITLRS